MVCACLPGSSSALPTLHIMDNEILLTQRLATCHSAPAPAVSNMHAISRHAHKFTLSVAARVSSFNTAQVSARASSFHNRPALGRSPSIRQPTKVYIQTGRRTFVTAAGLFGGTMTKDSIYDYEIKDADGKPVDMAQYKGKVVLIINVASACGYTPQYKDMATLYDKYKSQGLVILGFPCNQFGGQEPGSNAEVKKFAQSKGFKGPIMAKIDVNGSNEDPLFTYLKEKQGGILVSDIKWNFTKFLVSKDGEVVGRYGSGTTPMQIEEDIKKLL